jgi:hypothetical protein
MMNQLHGRRQLAGCQDNETKADLESTLHGKLFKLLFHARMKTLEVQKLG